MYNKLDVLFFTPVSVLYHFVNMCCKFGENPHIGLTRWTPTRGSGSHSLRSHTCDLRHTTATFLLQLYFLTQFTQLRHTTCDMQRRQICPCSDFVAWGVNGGMWRIGWDEWEFEKKVNNIWCYISCGSESYHSFYLFIRLPWYKGHVHLCQYVVFISVKLLCGALAIKHIF